MSTNTADGRKFDNGKPRMDLVPMLAHKAKVEVLTHGAEKYEADNWQKVPDAINRYYGALQRHLSAYWEAQKYGTGSKLDETGFHHLAHAMCCLEFLYEHDVHFSAPQVVDPKKEEKRVKFNEWLKDFTPDPTTAGRLRATEGD